ncbi:BTB-POZ and MATH domain protein [Striga asiatica]|uniref:BTB-POZ and MATH domain protein n=1 Tax=Striga asiatica TaxID=4170 RepID=A0A5A7RHU0_STRAF|nr:BTB-POZ and MATH domain protein [Striga asiatica]
MEEKGSESASLTTRRVEKGSHDWVVQPYHCRRKYGVDKPLESEEFWMCGRRWVLLLFPDGKTTVAYWWGYASLFLILRDDESTTGDIIHVAMCFSVLDQSGEGNDWVNDFGGRISSLEPGVKLGEINYIGRRELESPNYLRDDCLRIRCEIKLVTSEVETLPLIKVPKSSIAEDFGKLLESKAGADVLFRVGGESFSGHKWILVASSPVFRSRILNCPQSQEEIVIPDMEPRIFKAMLWFIYTGTLVEEDEEENDVSYSASFMGKILAAAHQFELRKLRKVCESSFLQKISAESVAYLLHLADLYHATELKAACLRFAAENRLAVLDSEGCEYLRQSFPSLYLELAYPNPSTSERKELDFWSKMTSRLMELF